MGENKNKDIIPMQPQENELRVDAWIKLPHNILYQAEDETKNTVKTYIGMTATTFKPTSQQPHIKYFKNRKYENETNYSNIFVSLLTTTDNFQSDG